MNYKLLSLLILVASCMNSATTPTYEYADGSANLYIITTAQLRYIPVKPEESSSGVYSAGEPKTLPITLIQYQALQTLFEKAINNTDSHIQNRVMMSAIVSSMSEDEKKQCIIKPGSADITAIESALKTITKD